MQSHVEMNFDVQPADVSSARLLEQFYAGDDRAFDRLVDRYRPQLIVMALGRLPKFLAGRRELAEDLATDALIRVFQTKHRPSTRWQQGKGPVGGWMSSILKNLLISRMRTKKGKEALGTDLESVGGDGRTERFAAQLQDHRLDSAHEQYVAEIERQRLLLAIAALPDDLQQVLHMKLDGRTHHEIAEQIGTSKSGVTRRIQAAHRTLQAHIAVA